MVKIYVSNLDEQWHAIWYGSKEEDIHCIGQNVAYRAEQIS